MTSTTTSQKNTDGQKMTPSTQNLNQEQMNK